MDRIGIALDAGEEIFGLVRDNGWKYFRIQHIERTQLPGVYAVTYLYDGKETRVILAGDEIETVQVKQ